MIQQVIILYFLEKVGNYMHQSLVIHCMNVMHAKLIPENASLLPKS